MFECLLTRGMWRLDKTAGSQLEMFQVAVLQTSDSLSRTPA